MQDFQKKIRTSKTEYKKAALEAEKQAEDHITAGAFPEFFIFTILPGNSGCHKGCWRSGSFSLPRFIRADSNNPCFLSSNNIPTRMLHKDKRDLLPKSSSWSVVESLATRKLLENVWLHEKARKQAIRPHE